MARPMFRLYFSPVSLFSLSIQPVLVIQFTATVLLYERQKMKAYAYAYARASIRTQTYLRTGTKSLILRRAQCQFCTFKFKF